MGFPTSAAPDGHRCDRERPLVSADVRHFERDMYVPTPKPLHTCPGLARWRHYSKKPYLVFVDESFRGFFEFDRRGYFVHGAFGVPSEEYDSLKADVADVHPV